MKQRTSCEPVYGPAELLVPVGQCGDVGEGEKGLREGDFRLWQRHFKKTFQVVLQSKPRILETKSKPNLNSRLKLLDFIVHYFIRLGRKYR